MFDRIAGRYDLLNRVISLGLDRGWRRQAVDALHATPGDRILDVATGTADMALLAARRVPGVRVDGIDPSPEMLRVGAAKVARSGLTGRVALATGSAEALPWPDGTFAGSMIAFGIRNVPDRPAGIAEMARVTRGGGRVVVLELTEPRGGALASFARAWVRHVVPALGAALSGSAEYRYLQRSIEAFPPPDVFAATMRDAGLQRVDVRPLGLGACCLFVGHAA